ncbi:MAG: BACON domain-containing protein [Rikenella sp.]|nr:BACON domain-containing protein [Rikenella sp.]
MCNDIVGDFKLTLSPASYTAVIGGGSFTLTITSNTSWAISYPSWCSGPTSGSGNATITVTVNSNAGNPARSGSITVKLDANPAISKSCSVSQSGLPTYGGSIMFGVKFVNTTPYSRNVSGNVSLVMDGVDLGSVYVSGTVPGNNSEGITLGGGELKRFSSTKKSVPINFGFVDYAGDQSLGGMSFSVSGNATGDEGVGDWHGSPAGKRCTGNVSFINSGDGDIMIYAIFHITGII